MRVKEIATGSVFISFGVEKFRIINGSKSRLIRLVPLRQELFPGRKDGLPVVLHADNGPAFGLGFIESFGERSNV